MVLASVSNPLAGMQWRGRAGRRGEERVSKKKRGKVKWIDWG